MHSWDLICLQRFYSEILSERTPLHLSSLGGHLDICLFLVEKGADANATDKEYATQPYAYAYKDALAEFA